MPYKHQHYKYQSTLRSNWYYKATKKPLIKTDLTICHLSLLNFLFFLILQNVDLSKNCFISNLKTRSTSYLGIFYLQKPLQIYLCITIILYLQSLSYKLCPDFYIDTIWNILIGGSFIIITTKQNGLSY